MAAKTRGFSIAQKLALLAGLPVAGALILASIVVSDAREQVRSAAALGSVEDLAQLAARISHTVHRLQLERAQLTLHTGEPADKDTRAQFAGTDEAMDALRNFLDARDTTMLPPRLARDLGAAQEALARLPEQRAAAQTSDADLVKLVHFYSGANATLVSAIAALMQLSDHGELLRTISTLVSVLQIKESASQEHAVLADVFTRGEFAPGAYKALVALVTEYAANERVLHATAADEARDAYNAAMEGEIADKTAAMRKSALETMDDDFGVDAAEWFELQGEKVERLRELEDVLNAKVKAVALSRIAASRRALTTGSAISAAVLLLSILLAWMIGRGVSNSVGNLTTAAAKVQRDKDYSARAAKVSNDELGMLTEAFNDMLVGIQARDTELESHRENLEKLVDERTAELTARNQAMRVVLDNVEEGLATVRLDGSLETETSRAFADWFGAPEEGSRLHSHLEKISPKVGEMTEVAWDCVAEDMLPWEMCLEQMPSELVNDGRHYHLAYRGVVNQGDELEGALLIATDITEELARQKREAAQQEMLGVLSHLAEDRSGFVEFMEEVTRLVNHTRERQDMGVTELMRTVHTIKGNCNLFGVSLVANAAHELEAFIVDHDQVPEDEAFETLFREFEAFQARVAPLVSDAEGALDVSERDLEQLTAAIERGASSQELKAQIESLRFEPAEKRLARLGERATTLAKRLGKGELSVVVDAADARLPAEGWSQFFGAMVHAIRNAIDHGIETPSEREELGKAGAPTLTLRFKTSPTSYCVELEDNGRGVNWDALAKKAAKIGMRAGTQAERMAVLFADGVSSRDNATDQSGRGVGMAALKQAAEDLQGSIEVVSQAGKGTTLRFVLPKAQSANRQVA